MGLYGQTKCKQYLDRCEKEMKTKPFVILLLIAIVSIFVVGQDDYDFSEFNLVEDASPQLGGDLDGQSTYDLINIVDGTFSGTVSAGKLALTIGSELEDDGGGYTQLSGDGVVNGGLTIAIPQSAGDNFYYGFGGTENHIFGQAGAAAINYDGAGEFLTVNTGQGITEVYQMDQHLLTTSAVTFASVNTGQGAHELYAMNQDVQTTDAPTFATGTRIGSLTLSDSSITDSNDEISIGGLRLGNSIIVDPCLDDVNEKHDWLISPDRDAEMGVRSNTNWRTLILAPGKHTTSATFVMDTNFVAISSMVSHGWNTTSLTGSLTSKSCTTAAIIRQTANNIRLSGFTVQNTATNQQGTTALLLDAADNGLSYYKDMLFLTNRVDGYDPTSAVITRCNGFPQTRSFKGTWVNVWANPDTGHGFRFFGTGTYDPVMWYCGAGDKSYIGTYNADGTIKGEHYYCYGKGKCFAYNIDTANSIHEDSLCVGCISDGEGGFGADCNTFATYLNCIATDGNAFGGHSSSHSNMGKGIFRGYAKGCLLKKASESFGERDDIGQTDGFVSGTIIDSTIDGLTYPIRCKRGASIRNSRISLRLNNTDAITLLDSNTKIYNTDLIVDAAGTGIPINASTPLNVRAAHCRMNNADIQPTGLDPNVTNLIGTPYNVVDDDIN